MYTLGTINYYDFIKRLFIHNKSNYKSLTNHSNRTTDEMYNLNFHNY